MIYSFIMGIRILHVNIRNWKSNNYLLKCSLSNSNPDVILLNEISLSNNLIPKIRGYSCNFKCEERFSGVAIFVKHTYTHTHIDFKNNNILSIKLHTNIGPIYIITSYSPPRHHTIPTIEINHILNKNLPTLIISDFNARHPHFDNCTSTSQTNNFGKQLHSLCNSRNLSYLGPNFNTFRNNDSQGKPDLVLVNNQFRIFHHLISKGGGVGSDHLPIIFDLALHPIKVLCPPKLIIDKIDKLKFKELLSNDRFESLDGRDFHNIDSRMTEIVTKINDATVLSCPTRTNFTIQNYEFTIDIKVMLRTLQEAYANYFLFNNPNLHFINNLKNQLLIEINSHQKSQWRQLVETAAECYGDPASFWKKINMLRGRERVISQNLWLHHRISQPSLRDNQLKTLKRRLF